jgi:hypothetical protein
MPQGIDRMMLKASRRSIGTVVLACVAYRAQASRIALSRVNTSRLNRTLFVRCHFRELSP